MDLWEASFPATWKRAATDWRALYVLDEVPRRGRAQLATDLGYAGPSKLDTLSSEARKLRALAGAGDQEALDRIARAEALGRILNTPKTVS